MNVPAVKSPWRAPLSSEDNHELSAPQDEADHIYRHSPFQSLPSPLPSRLHCQTCKDTSPLRCPRPPSVGSTESPAVGTQPGRIFLVVLFLFLVSTTTITTKNIGIDDEVNLNITIPSQTVFLVFLFLSLGTFVFAPTWQMLNW